MTFFRFPFILLQKLFHIFFFFHSEMKQVKEIPLHTVTPSHTQTNKTQAHTHEHIYITTIKKRDLKLK